VFVPQSLIYHIIYIYIRVSNKRFIYFKSDAGEEFLLTNLKFSSEMSISVMWVFIS
jgi:hypothetical protein